MSEQGNTIEKTSVVDEQKRDLNKRLESVSWGLFLVMLGGIWLIPDERVPEGLWLIGAGLIMLGLNAARYFNGIRMSGFTIFLGFIALLTGFGDFIGIDLPVFPILLILVGASLLLRPLFERRTR